MTVVKICGIIRLEDALAAAEAGADMIGLNFYRKSPRFIEVEAATLLCSQLRAELGAECPLIVGLFVNEIVGRISITMERVGFKYVQLSGDESTEMLRELKGTAYKAIRPRTRDEALSDIAYFSPDFSTDARIPSILVDAYHPDLYGGTGEGTNSEVAKAARDAVPRLMLAGGLTPENVAARVSAIQPWGVDVASGVENGAPGVKDAAKMRDFVMAVRGNN